MGYNSFFGEIDLSMFKMTKQILFYFLTPPPPLLHQAPPPKAVKKAPVKATPAKNGKAAPKVEVEEDDDEDEDESGK